MRRTPFANICLLVAFLFNSVITVPVSAQELVLPKPGVMLRLSPPVNPAMLKGMKVDTRDPFKFEFVLDQGDERSTDLKDESTRLIKYFLASLTIPERDLWVNLSPYEKDRVIPDSFGTTEMGRDLLAQDYILKQVTASLIYPEDEIGRRFWKRVYEKAAERYKTTNIPVNTFNKVWIVPEKAVVYENAKAGTAYVVESRLKVMLESDYLSLSKNTPTGGHVQEGTTRNVSPSTLPSDPAMKVKAPQGVNRSTDELNQLASEIVREIVIPELTREVNEGKNFAQLRQVYNSLILATWYKKKIKDSILSKVYADKNKIASLSPEPSSLNPEAIYKNYLEAFKKGAYNYIKEDIDPVTQERTPRKYFSGGVKWDMAMMSTVEDLPMELPREHYKISIVFKEIPGSGGLDLNRLKRLASFKSSSRRDAAIGLIDLYGDLLTKMKRAIDNFIDPIGLEEAQLEFDSRIKDDFDAKYYESEESFDPRKARRLARQATLFALDAGLIDPTVSPHDKQMIAYDEWIKDELKAQLRKWLEINGVSFGSTAVLNGTQAEIDFINKYQLGHTQKELEDELKAGSFSFLQNVRLFYLYWSIAHTSRLTSPLKDMDHKWISSSFESIIPDYLFSQDELEVIKVSDMAMTASVMNLIGQANDIRFLLRDNLFPKSGAYSRGVLTGVFNDLKLKVKVAYSDEFKAYLYIVLSNFMWMNFDPRLSEEQSIDLRELISDFERFIATEILKEKDISDVRRKAFLSAIYTEASGYGDYQRTNDLNQDITLSALLKAEAQLREEGISKEEIAKEYVRAYISLYKKLDKRVVMPFMEGVLRNRVEVLIGKAEAEKKIKYAVDEAVLKVQRLSKTKAKNVALPSTVSALFDDLALRPDALDLIDVTEEEIVEAAYQKGLKVDLDYLEGHRANIEGVLGYYEQMIRELLTKYDVSDKTRFIVLGRDMEYFGDAMRAVLGPAMWEDRVTIVPISSRIKEQLPSSSQEAVDFIGQFINYKALKKGQEEYIVLDTAFKGSTIAWINAVTRTALGLPPLKETEPKEGNPIRGKLLVSERQWYPTFGLSREPGLMPAQSFITPFGISSDINMTLARVSQLLPRFHPHTDQLESKNIKGGQMVFPVSSLGRMRGHPWLSIGAKAPDQPIPMSLGAVVEDEDGGKAQVTDWSLGFDPVGATILQAIVANYFHARSSIIMSGSKEFQKHLSLNNKTVLVIPSASSIGRETPEQMKRFYEDNKDIVGPIYADASKVMGEEFPVERLLLSDLAKDGKNLVVLVVTHALYVYAQYQVMLKKSEGRYKPEFLTGNSIGLLVSMVISGALSMNDLLGFFKEGLRFMEKKAAETDFGILQINNVTPGSVAGLLRKGLIEAVSYHDKKAYLAVLGSKSVLEEEKLRIAKLLGIAPEQIKAEHPPAVKGVHHSFYGADFEEFVFRLIDAFTFNEPGLPIIDSSDPNISVIRTAKELRSAFKRVVFGPVYWGDVNERLDVSGAKQLVLASDPDSSKRLEGYLKDDNSMLSLWRNAISTDLFSNKGIERYLEIRQIVNPQGKPLRVFYAGSGADVLSPILAVGGADIAMVLQERFEGEEFDRFLDEHWIKGWEPWMQEGLLDDLKERGFIQQINASSGPHFYGALMTVLKNMGVSRQEIIIDKNDRTITINKQWPGSQAAAVRLTFIRTEDMLDASTHTPLFKEALDSEYDVVLEKAGRYAPNVEALTSAFEKWLPMIKVKSKGYYVLDTQRSIKESENPSAIEALSRAGIDARIVWDNGRKNEYGVFDTIIQRAEEPAVSFFDGRMDELVRILEKEGNIPSFVSKAVSFLNDSSASDDLIIEVGGGTTELAWQLAKRNPDKKVIVLDSYNISSYDRFNSLWEEGKLKAQTDPLDNLVVLKIGMEEFFKYVPYGRIADILMVSPSSDLVTAFSGLVNEKGLYEKLKGVSLYIKPYRVWRKTSEAFINHGEEFLGVNVNRYSYQGQWSPSLIKDIYRVKLGEGSKDPMDEAMTAKGGIDLNTQMMSIETTGEGETIYFKMDDTMIRRLEAADGFYPVIINIQPLSDLRLFLTSDSPSLKEQKAIT